MITSRRHLLAMAALSASAWPLPNLDAAQTAATVTTAPTGKQQTLDVPEPLQDQLNDLFGDSPIPLGQVNLSLPALAENGNSVALGVTINQVAAAYPKALYVFAEKNPLPDILRCEFSPSARANQQIDARIRLSNSQRIIAISRFSDGTLRAGEASIVVTLAACIDIPT